MDHVTGLSIARIALGTGMLVAPEKSLRAGFLDATAPQAPYLARLFGSREIAVGVVTLLAAPAAKPALIKVGIGIDVADAAAGVLAVRSRGLSTPVGALVTGAALAAVVGGVAGLRQRGELPQV